MPMFEQSSNFSIHDGLFVDQSQTHNYFGTNGLQILLDSTLPEAAYDSFTRHSSPHCFPGTRKQYIEDIVDWVRSERQRQFRLTWLTGPAGVGKSAVAQTCAEMLQAELGAAFFFSRPNRIVNPNRFFTSIAYQLAIRVPPYADLLELRIRRDPTLVSKSLRVQFRELIVAPFQELASRGVSVGESERLIIIDGLDECHGHHFQCEIIHTIVMFQHALPFLWAIFSRSEPHIESAILSDAPGLSTRWWKITLPVSQDTDKDIKLYLKSGFERIEQQYGLTSQSRWPSDADIEALVRKSAGLFVYAATVVRFFDNPALPEREKQLENLLTSKISLLLGPLSGLDDFYSLIMGCIPHHILPYTLNLLLVLASELFTSDPTLIRVSNLLGYSSTTTLSSLYNLRSVISLQKYSGGDASGSQDIKISLYHYSFMEFLRDHGRSKGFHVFQSNCLVFWTRRCLRILTEYDGGGQSAILLSNWTDESGTPEQKASLQNSLFREASCSLLEACARVDLAQHPDLLQQLHTLDYRKVSRATIGLSNLTMCIREESLLSLSNQLPPNPPGSRWGGKLIRERLMALNSLTRGLYILKSKLGAGDQPTPRVLPAYEVGYGEKMIYLYPERGSLGILYRVSESLEELKEPYIFSDSEIN